MGLWKGNRGVKMTANSVQRMKSVSRPNRPSDSHVQALSKPKLKWQANKRPKKERKPAGLTVSQTCHSTWDSSYLENPAAVLSNLKEPPPVEGSGQRHWRLVAACGLWSRRKDCLWVKDGFVKAGEGILCLHRIIVNVELESGGGIKRGWQMHLKATQQNVKPPLKKFIKLS